MGICRECVKEKPASRSPERQHLKRGPDGEKLCSSHAKEAWNNRSVDTGKEQSEEGSQ